MVVSHLLQGHSQSTRYLADFVLMAGATTHSCEWEVGNGCFPINTSLFTVDSYSTYIQSYFFGAYGPRSRSYIPFSFVFGYHCHSLSLAGLQSWVNDICREAYLDSRSFSIRPSVRSANRSTVIAVEVFLILVLAALSFRTLDKVGCPGWSNWGCTSLEADELIM